MNHFKHWIDWASIFGAVATFFDYLPHVFALAASFLAVIWWALRVYEMDTVQKWLKRRGRCKW